MELNLQNLLTIGSMIIASTSLIWNVLRSLKKDTKDDGKELQDVQIRLAVLEERVAGEMKILTKVEEKLNDIEEKL